MKPKLYETNVLVTESTDFDAIKARIDPSMVRMLHAGLGMSSELAEIVQAQLKGTVDWVNIMEETADVLWYVAVAVNCLGFDHNDISSFEANGADGTSLFKHSDVSLLSAISAITFLVGDYNDLLKKHLFYGRELDKEKLKKVLSQLCMGLSGLCYVSGYTIEQARETNIKKLKVRFENKFSEAEALNRDLETERNVLEGKV